MVDPSDAAPDDIARLLREIRDDQHVALALPREHMAMHQRQLDRVGRINDRAEAIHAAPHARRLIVFVALPLVGLPLAVMFSSYLIALFA